MKRPCINGGVGLQSKDRPREIKAVASRYGLTGLTRLARGVSGAVSGITVTAIDEQLDPLRPSFGAEPHMISRAFIGKDRLLRQSRMNARKGKSCL